MAELSVQNTDTTSANQSGFKAINDSGSAASFVIGGSTNANANRGSIQTSSLGFDITLGGTGKTFRVITNSVARVTISDTGVLIPVLSLSTALAVASGG